MPNTLIRGYVTLPPGQGYTVVMVDHTTESHPTKSGKTIKKPNVVDATGQELPQHETTHGLFEIMKQVKILEYLQAIKINLKDLNLSQIIM